MTFGVIGVSRFVLLLYIDVMCFQISSTSSEVGFSYSLTMLCLMGFPLDSFPYLLVQLFLSAQNTLLHHSTK